MSAKRRLVKVGVIGVGRGMSFATRADEITGMELVAICDSWKEKLKEAGKKLGCATYTDYDKFLEHDMDAVILANYFNEHTPFAIKALRAGKHVMSECSSNSTMAEGVALCREVEKTGLIYMLAENYCYTKFNMEMRRLYKAGEIGRVLYADGEYGHPMAPRDKCAISPGVNHWRNWCPSTYYCTHAMAPLMYITDDSPVKVSALSIVSEEIREHSARLGDVGSVIFCRTKGGAVFRLFQVGIPGHSCWYRLHGTRGAMEITRGGFGYFGPEQVRVWHERWDMKPGDLRERIYSPEWPKYGDLANRAGHGGGDFWTNMEFAEAIRSGRQPYLDVYRGVTMSSVGILGWRSALEDGKPFDMPNFRSERSRKPYENDNWSPWPKDAGPGQPPPSIRGFIKPNPKGLAYARKVWKEIGVPRQVRSSN